MIRYRQVKPKAIPEKLTIKMSKKNKQKLIDKKKRLNEYLKTLPQSTFQQNYITEDIFDHDSD